MKQTLLIIVLIFSSCKQSNIQQILNIIDTMIENHPENALKLLETISDPKLLTQKEYIEYELAYIKAKDKCHINLTGDTTTIIDILNYYKPISKNKSKGWTFYYAGRIFQDASNDKTANQYFLEAANYAKQHSDYELGVMSNYYLAEFHAKQFSFDKALVLYKTALDYSHLDKKQKFNSILLSSIGFTFGQSNQMDSALTYLKNAYSTALEQKDTIQIINTSNDLSLFLTENNQYKEAKTYILSTISLSSDSIILSPHIILADIYVKTNKVDSAIFILKQIEKFILTSSKTEDKAAYYETLSDIEEARQNHSKALEYYKLYTNYQDSIYQEKKNIFNANIEQKYNYIKTKEYNKQLTNEKRNIIFITIMISLTSLIIAYYFRQKNKQKRNELYDAEEKLNMLQCLLEKENKIQTDPKDINKLNNEEKEHLLKKLLVKQLDISTKIALMNAQNPDKNHSFLTKFNEIMYGEQRSFQLNWDELYFYFNILYGNFVHILQTNHKVLVEKDIQLCCLLLIDLATAEITFLMKQSVHTVHKRKTEIRKKLNMPEGADIASFLKKKIQIQP